jgi:predicted nucleotide-binding protein/tetratricopeptide (TPR) repeat protein
MVFVSVAPVVTDQGQKDTMKPRAFVGSSVEGLAVAYAIQQNLLYDAEITVWSQGVFQLSAGAVDSLLEVLGSSDFGIFVFTPDDITTIRSTTSSAIRDNVLFELGLFMGKLGKDRAFFLVPDNVPDLHLATDLIGVNPAKYEGGRTDANMQAATGPACHEMRQQIKKLGTLPSRTQTPSNPEEVPAIAKKVESHWIEHFFEARYVEAKQLLEVERQSQTGEARANTDAWIAYCDIKRADPLGLSRLLALAKEQVKSAGVLVFISTILRAEKFPQQAVDVLRGADASIQTDPTVMAALADSLSEFGEKTKAIDLLAGVSQKVPELSIKQSELLQEVDQIDAALRVICEAYLQNPTHEGVRFRIARVAEAANKHEIAAFLLTRLTAEFPKKSTYWGYLGNACTMLRLYDQALVAYRAGSACTDTSIQWILANIGNLLSTRDLPSDACTYLETVIKTEPSSYAYDRYATALKKKEAEAKQLGEKCQEGMRQLAALAAPNIESAPPNPA